MATYIATVLVAIYMFATYGVFGFIANIALVVHVGLIFGLMSVLEATLTLPGIAGIVLTIGTAGRLERLDLRAHPRGGEGRALCRLGHPGRVRTRFRDHRRLELDDGDRGPHPVLPGFGSGPRLRRRVYPRHPHDRDHGRDPDPHDDRALVRIYPSQGDPVLGPQPVRLLRLWPEETRFDFMRLRHLSFPFSAAISIAIIVTFMTVGLNYGIDFTGGTLIEMRAKSGKADLGPSARRPTVSASARWRCRNSGTRAECRSVSGSSPGGEAAQTAVIEKARGVS
jgi:SecD/SecF fusion protein